VKEVIIHAEAEVELSESIAFYERRRTGLGVEFERAIRAIVVGIPSNPQRYPLQNDGTRRVAMKRFPFGIHYVELPNTIWILAFAHTSRKPGYWRSRF
jgi:hypothetical protein